MLTGRRSKAIAPKAVTRAAIPANPWLLVMVLPLFALLSGCEGAPTAEGIGAAGGYGYVCHAGFYQCTLPQQVPLGSRCSCPGLGAPSYGRVG